MHRGSTGGSPVVPRGPRGTSGVHRDTDDFSCPAVCGGMPQTKGEPPVLPDALRPPAQTTFFTSHNRTKNQNPKSFS